MGTIKVVINSCYGGFGLSTLAIKELGGRDDFYENRSDPDLVKVVEELKNKANRSYSKLESVEIPDDVEWAIEDYDGIEWVAEKHRTWPCCEKK